MFKTLVLMTLLSLTTNAFAENEDVVLNPGSKAPFRGVLVDETRYKFYTESALQVPILTNALENSRKENEEVGGISFMEGMVVFSFGVCAGMLIAYGLNHK